MIRGLRGPMADWSVEALLLRQIDLRLAGANWQRAGGKGRRPEPIPLPDRKQKPKVDGAELARRLANLGQIPVGSLGE